MSRRFPSLHSGCMTVGVCRREDVMCMRVCRGFTLACNHCHTITVRFQKIPTMTFEHNIPQSEVGAGTSSPIRDSLTVTRHLPSFDRSTRSSVSTWGQVSPSVLKMKIKRVAGWSLQHMAGMQCNCFSVHLMSSFFSSLFFKILIYPINNINVNVMSTDSHIQ